MDLNMLRKYLLSLLQHQEILSHVHNINKFKQFSTWTSSMKISRHRNTRTYSIKVTQHEQVLSNSHGATLTGSMTFLWSNMNKFCPMSTVHLGTAITIAPSSDFIVAQVNLRAGLLRSSVNLKLKQDFTT